MNKYIITITLTNGDSLEYVVMANNVRLAMYYMRKDKVYKDFVGDNKVAKTDVEKVKNCFV